MTRAEYLKELEANLVTLPKEERDMAVEFYNEYFEDAGAENEQAVIDELGKPFNLARSIIGETSAYNKSEVYIKYRESKPMPQNSTGVFASLQKPDAFGKDTSFDEKIKAGLKNDAPEQKPQDEDIMPNGSPYHANFNIEHDAAPKFDDTPKNNSDGMFDQYYTHANSGEKNSGYYNGNTYNSYNSQNDHTSAGKILLWIFLFIFVIIPIIIPVAISVLAVAAAIAICAVVCIFAAFVTLIAGIIRLFTSFFEGIAAIAVGIACAGAGMILTAITLLFFCKFLPWLAKRIFSGKRREA